MPNPPTDPLSSIREKIATLVERAEVASRAGTPFDDLAIELRRAVADLEERREDDRERRLRKLEIECSNYRDLFLLAPEAYVVTNAVGMIRDANGAAATLLGVRGDFLVGKPLAAFVDPEERVEFRSWLAELSVRRVCAREHRLVPRDREPFVAELRVASSLEPAGRHPRLRWMIRDLSEQKRVEREMRRWTGELEARVQERTTELESASRAKEALLEREREARELAERLLADARDADRRKNEFLAMLGHELRNPLAPIVSSLRILETVERAPGGEGARGMARQARLVAQRQSQNLTRIVDDLLEVSRVERGRVILERRVLDLAGPIASALDAVRDRVDERRQERSIRLAPEPLWVDGDATRLEQIFVNLLDNASKYTPMGGRIELGVERDGDVALVRVRDDGFGIGDDVLAHLFEPFTQAPQSLARSAGGLGLGLALTKRLVELHGGSIGATTFGPNRGSEFVVRLPLAAAPQGAEGDGSGDASRPARRRVLVVDDNVDAADSLADVLRIQGYEADVAYDGPSVIDLAARTAPHAILLDIGLPDVNGYEVARRLRGSEAGRSCLLVAVTGYGGSADRKAAEEAGFDVFLTKPVDPEALERLLAERLGAG